MRFGSTAKVLLKCKLKYYRISECMGACAMVSSSASDPDFGLCDTKAERSLVQISVEA